MACNSLSGIPKNDCSNNIGGVKNIWLISEDSINVTYGTTLNEGFISAITAVATGNSDTTFEQYNPIRYTASYSENTANELVNGNTMYTTSLVIPFTRREASKSRELHILAEGQRYLAALIQDGNGKYFLLRDLQLSTNESTSGVAKADGQKYTVTLTGMDDSYAREITFADAAELNTLLTTRVYTL